MSSNQNTLYERLEEASSSFEAFSGELAASSRNGLLGNDLSQLLTSLKTSVGAQLEALQLLAGGD
jgi:hypothetical protein